MIANSSLSPSHRAEWVNDSCVNPLLLNNIKSIEGDEIYEYLFAFSELNRRNDGRLRDKDLKRYQHCTDGGWWFNSVDIRAGESNDYGCFKPDNPRENPENGKIIKYETPPNSGSQLFAFDIPKEIWDLISSRCEVKKGKSSHFYQWLYNNPKVPLFITEGAKKTGCLLSQGYAAIGLNGWTGLYQNIDNERQINPDLAFLLENRDRVYLCFDQDINKSTKSMIHKGLRRFIHLVDQAFPKVQVLKVTWPAAKGKGVDDFVKANGADALHHQVKLARKLKPLDDEPKPEILIDQETGDKFIESKYPPTEQCLRDLYRDKHYAGINGELYAFNGKFYEKCDENAEKRRIRAWALEHPELINNKLVYTSLSTPRIDGILSYIILTNGVNSDLVNPPGLNLDNGILKLIWESKAVSWELIDHSPYTIYTYCSPVSFDKSAPQEHCNKLLSCLDSSQQAVFLRSIAASFDLDAVRERGGRLRAILAEGKGNNGKDSLKTSIELLLGEKMCSLTFNDFQMYDQGRKFPLSRLETTALSWSSENAMSPKLDNLQALKAAISGDTISIEPKNQKEKEFKPSSVFIFNINGFPNLTGGFEAILSRWCVLSFRKTFKKNADPTKNEIEADPRFRYDRGFLIKEVCPALLNRLLAELNLLLEEWIDYDSLSDSLREIQEETNHLWGFCREVGLTANPNGKIYTSDLWDLLRKWYEDNGTLEVVTNDKGKTKNIWHEQANRWDKNCTAANQIFSRFSALFPSIKRGKETQDLERKGQAFLSGLSIEDFASLPHNPVTVSDSASPSASLCLTSASLPLFEEKKEDQDNKNGLKTLPHKESEAEDNFSEAEVRQAVRQNPLPSKESEAVRQKDRLTANSLAVKSGDQVLFNGNPCIVKAKNGSLWWLKPVDGGCSFWANETECVFIPSSKPLAVGDWVKVSWSNADWQISEINKENCRLIGIDSETGKTCQFWVDLSDVSKSEAKTNNGKE